MLVGMLTMLYSFISLIAILLILVMRRFKYPKTVLKIYIPISVAFFIFRILYISQGWLSAILLDLTISFLTVRGYKTIHERNQ
ncbi:hypothetical protein HMPREF2861_02155 [Lactobacillus sp. HMSC068F07]|nr:hypothetical protein HMPREF2861_02155 [Lactobacillus sp. HMSC068F07]